MTSTAGSTPGSTTIGITGATGHIGGQVARLLAADLPAGTSLRLLVRDASRAPDLPGADVVEVQYGDPAAVEALTGVDVLLMVSAAESDDRVGEHRAFVEHAVEAGVGHLVYTSFVGATPDCGFLLGRDHAATEEIIRGTGVASTFLRDNFYAEVFPLFADDDGVLRGPAGHGLVAPVSRRDVAEVAAAVLRAPADHVGATYDLTGPEALTLAEIADVLTEVTGRPHRFHDETLEEARASRAHYGAPDWMVEAWISTYTAIRDGELAAVSDGVPRLLGRPATSFREAVTPA
ncbi:SDR family oxidoreductase [Nocardioides sp. HDW12B]|uniref:SDR family oxidoreductase n=1 Tax=Nocardioides sp. HDW12B TaxID=2714939 RepID=UPI00140AFFAD|nr:SDR family oxidoreductase [Nocardioides sp. HDW12B]QIK66388.1 SDR family oxidoreductase [Nocardioides sp. HDW12B]